MDRWIAHQKTPKVDKSVPNPDQIIGSPTSTCFCNSNPYLYLLVFSATDSDSLHSQQGIILWFGFLFTLLLPFFWANSGYILQHCIKHRLKLLFCGPTGTGKILGHRGRTQRGKMWEVGPWIPTFWNRWQMSTIVRNYMTFIIIHLAEEFVKQFFFWIKFWMRWMSLSVCHIAVLIRVGPCPFDCPRTAYMQQNLMGLSKESNIAPKFWSWWSLSKCWFEIIRNCWSNSEPGIIKYHDFPGPS